jgi:RimJ/RimL family protein N-acetyltransferase
VRVEDWALATPAEMAPLITAEVQAWRSDLDWDVEREWREVEIARAAGRLSGLVARNESGHIVGWTFFLLHHGALQIAALSSLDILVTRRLIGGILASPVAAEATVVAASLRCSAVGLAKALSEADFGVADYGYWVATPLVAITRVPGLRPWRLEDLLPTIDLCSRAYGQIAEVRAFAPLGTDTEWTGYVTELVHSGGCGRLIDDASFVVEDEDGAPQAFVLTTRISATVAHIAQVVVEPADRRQGLATSLVHAAMSSVAAAGFRRVTLFVSDSNDRAARIYRRLGFKPAAKFIVASTAGTVATRTLVHHAQQPST